MQLYQDLEQIKQKQEDVINILTEKRILTNPQEIIYDNSDVMLLLKISQRTLANWRASGIITFRKIGGKLYYTQADINECLNKNKYEKFKN